MSVGLGLALGLVFVLCVFLV